VQDHKRDMDMLTKKFTKSQTELSETQATLQAITSERDDFRKRLGMLPRTASHFICMRAHSHLHCLSLSFRCAAGMAEIEKELVLLREQAAECKALKAELEQANAKLIELDKMYKDEQILRKRYGTYPPASRHCTARLL
jgi:chromosome segregation ATPase